VGKKVGGRRGDKRGRVEKRTGGEKEKVERWRGSREGCTEKRRKKGGWGRGKGERSRGDKKGG